MGGARVRVGRTVITVQFDATAMHAYWSDPGPTRWNALRWRIFPGAVPRKLVTECSRDQVRDGPDGTLVPPPGRDGYGWQLQGIDGDTMLREFVGYDRELVADDVYACAFTTSPDDEWRRKGYSLDDLADSCDFKRIGPHDLLGQNPAALRWAERAPIVKSCDSTAAIGRARSDAITVYRRRFNPAEQSAMLASPEGGHRLAAAILDGLHGFRHRNLYAELLNEVGRGDRLAYLALAKDATRDLRAAGIKVAGPSWATGDFEAIDWQTFTQPDGGNVADIVLSVPMRTTLAADTNYSRIPRPRTIGVVVHSTRGGGRREVEFTATVNWFATPDAGVSAHLVVGLPPFEEVNRSVPDDFQAFHARELNASHLGIELCQPGSADGFTDFQYRAAGEAIRLWAEKYHFPIVRVMDQNQPGLIGHEDSAAGKRDGKSDPGPRLDWARLISIATGGSTPVATPDTATALRDECYADAARLQAKSARWTALGYPQTAQLVTTSMEAFKTAIGPIGKGER